MALGYGTNVSVSNRVKIDNAAITYIGGQVGWSTPSDGRFKSNLKENVPGLEFINKLKSVAYNLQLQKIDQLLGKKDSLINAFAADYASGEKKLHTGFVAQDVEKAAQEIGYDFDGVNHPQNDKDHYSLAYADLVPSLVKAVQQLSQDNGELKARIEKLKASISNQSAASTSVAITSAGLRQNIPSPFNHTTTINYTLPQTYSSVKIIVTDKSGKALREVNVAAKGKGSLNLDASTLAAGAYRYSLYVNGRLVDTKQMVLTK